MKKLIDIYERHLELGETYFLLGISSPNNISNYTEDLLIQQFLYTYSHLGLSAMEILSIENLKNRLLQDIKTLNNYHKLCNEQKWWSLALLYLRIGSEYYNLTFFTSTINTLLDKVHNLSPEELTEYCNTMNDCMSNIIGFELRIRPSKDNNKSAYISNAYLNMTSNTENIIKIFKDFLSIENMINDEVQKEEKLLKNIGCDFDLWYVVFDIFVGQLLISLDTPVMNLGDSNRYENATESALLNLTSKADFLPPNLNIVCKKVSTFLG